MTPYLVFIGSAINFLGIFSYFRDTLRGVTKPNRVTWLFWSLAPLISSVAAYVDGVRLATLPVFAMGLCSLLVFFATFLNKNAYWKLNPLDYVCGVFSFLALVLWWITQEPLVAIILSIIGDAFAALPTILKSWSHPETESGAAYVTSIVSALTSFTVITTWTFSEYGFPLYLVIINLIVVIALYHHKFISKIRN